MSFRKFLKQWVSPGALALVVSFCLSRLFRRRGQDSVQVMQLARVVDLTALAIVVCAFHDQFAHAPRKRLLHFHFKRLSALLQWYFRVGRDVDGIEFRGKSNERYQISRIRCAR